MVKAELLGRTQNCQTSKMERFAKIVNGWKLIWQVSEYASVNSDIPDMLHLTTEDS